MKTKLTLFVTVLAAALFGVGCSSLNKGLVAYYPFNGNAKDESGKGHHGAVIKVTPTTDRHGVDAKAYSFNGKYERIILPAYQYGSSFTISLWVYSVDIPSGVIFAKKPHRTVDSVQFGAGEKFFTRIYSEDDVWVGRTAPISKLTSGHWLHLAVTYDGGSTPSAVKIYWDGIRIDDSDDKSGEFTTFNDLNVATEIGSQNQGRDGFKGSIDDVRIYNRALSAEEIKSLYDLEKPKTK